MDAVRVSIGAVAVAAFWGVAVLGASMLPMVDPDTWWHIRVGREIIENGTVPGVDSWSIVGAGRTWVSQDWLSNVLMAAAYGIGSWGPTFVSALYGLMAAAAFALLWNAVGIRDPGIGWLARAAWLLFGLVLAAPVLGARVQVVDLLLAALVLNVIWRYLASPRSWHLPALPAIAVAWVNLHAGFPLLFLIGGAVVVGELAQRHYGGSPTLAGGGRGIGQLTVSLLLALSILVLNPNGVAIYAYPFETLGIGALSSFVGEWQPARLTAPAGQLLTAFVLTGVLPSLLVAPRRLRVADGLLLVGFTFMAVTAVRFLLIAGPIGAVVVCVAVSPLISASRLGRGAAPLLARMDRAPLGRRGVVHAVLLGVVLIGGAGLAVARIMPAGQKSAIAAEYPAEALAWVRANDVGSRMFNRYEWGGYIGLQQPEKPIFIDGRADIYGDAIIRGYVETISVNQDPGAYFVQHGIDHVIYPRNSTLGAWLDGSSDWRVAYSDEVATVWVLD